MKQWKGLYIVFVLLLISGLVSNCDALSSIKKSTTSITQSAKSTINEFYSVTINGKSVQLKLIKSFSGNNSKIVEFTSEKSPAVITWGVTPTSKIQSSFDWSWQSEYENNLDSDFWTIYYSPFNVNYKILDGNGKFRLRIQSSGCSWWIKVGIEK